MKKANLAGAVWLRPTGVFGEFDVKFMPNFRSVNLTNSWAKFDEKIKMFFTKVVKFARLNLTNDFVKFGSNLTDRQTAGRILAIKLRPTGNLAAKKRMIKKISSSKILLI